MFSRKVLSNAAICVQSCRRGLTSVIGDLRSRWIVFLGLQCIITQSSADVGGTPCYNNCWGKQPSLFFTSKPGEMFWLKAEKFDGNTSKTFTWSDSIFRNCNWNLWNTWFIECKMSMKKMIRIELSKINIYWYIKNGTFLGVIDSVKSLPQSLYYQ